MKIRLIFRHARTAEGGELDENHPLFIVFREADRVHVFADAHTINADGERIFLEHEHREVRP